MGPTIPLPNGPWFALSERNTPGSIIVNAAGEWYINEACPMSRRRTEVWRHPRPGPGPGETLPSWMMLDQECRDRYLFAGLQGGQRFPRKWLDSGVVVKADTTAKLANKNGVDVDGLTPTVERFNRFARTGIDEDFHPCMSVIPPEARSPPCAAARRHAVVCKLSGYTHRGTAIDPSAAGPAVPAVRRAQYLHSDPEFAAAAASRARSCTACAPTRGMQGDRRHIPGQRREPGPLLRRTLRRRSLPRRDAPSTWKDNDKLLAIITAPSRGDETVLAGVELVPA